MIDRGLVDPSRLVAVGVIVLVVAAVGFFGFRQDGPRPNPNDWRNIVIAESNFGVTAPGAFFTGEQNMSFEGIDTIVRTYLVPDHGTDYSVLVAQRPPGDTRTFKDVAVDMKLTGANYPEQMNDLTRFRHDVTVDGNRTQAAIFFRDRMLYQLMVTAPRDSFSPANAERYFSSFHLLSGAPAQ